MSKSDCLDNWPDSGKEGKIVKLIKELVYTSKGQKFDEITLLSVCQNHFYEILNIQDGSPKKKYLKYKKVRLWYIAICMKFIEIKIKSYRYCTLRIVTSLENNTFINFCFLTLEIVFSVYLHSWNWLGTLVLFISGFIQIFKKNVFDYDFNAIFNIG